jgi:Raf kinase inhibitor-like YbhB/YbcL family protein
MSYRLLVTAVAAALFLGGVPHSMFSATKGNIMELKVTSTAFKEGEMIPKRHTCDGQDASPSLAWTEGPGATKSFVLICDDPDAPVGTWIHWVLFNVPPTTRELPENVAPERTLAFGERHGKNSWGRLGYGGPCPPGGTHRYYFKLYALDTLLTLEPGVTKDQVEKAMRGHVLAQGQLMGRYRRG